VSAVGVASFGSVDLDISSSSYGYITPTSKPGWLNCDLVGDINVRSAFRSVSLPT
jgi:fructokinase